MARQPARASPTKLKFCSGRLRFAPASVGSSVRWFPPSRPTFARTGPRLCRPSAVPLSPVLFRCLPGLACSAGPPFGPVNGLLPPVPGVLVVGGRPDASAPVRPPPSVCAGGGAGFGCVAFVGRALLNDRAHKCARTGPNLQGLFYDFSAKAEKVRGTNKIHILFMFLQNMNKTLSYFVQVCLFIDLSAAASLSVGQLYCRHFFF